MSLRTIIEPRVATLVDAKGDLLVGSAADTPAKLAVGADGTVPVANAGDTLGIGYAYPSIGGLTDSYRAMSTLKAATFDPALVVSGSALGDQAVNWYPIYLPFDATITGMAWFQHTQGDYTADQYNGVGLYTSDGTSLTLVASSTNDGNIWKGASNSVQQKAFSATYAAQAGLYFAAMLYNQSAQNTAPQVGGRTGLAAGSMGQALMRNANEKWSGTLAAQNSLPAGPQAWSGVSVSATNRWLGLY